MYLLDSGRLDYLNSRQIMWLSDIYKLFLRQVFGKKVVTYVGRYLLDSGRLDAANLQPSLHLSPTLTTVTTLKQDQNWFYWLNRVTIRSQRRCPNSHTLKVTAGETVAPQNVHGGGEGLACQFQGMGWLGNSKICMCHGQ